MKLVNLQAVALSRYAQIFHNKRVSVNAIISPLLAAALGIFVVMLTSGELNDVNEICTPWLSKKAVVWVGGHVFGKVDSAQPYTYCIAVFVLVGVALNIAIVVHVAKQQRSVGNAAKVVVSAGLLLQASCCS